MAVSEPASCMASASSRSASSSCDGMSDSVLKMEAEFSDWINSSSWAGRRVGVTAWQTPATGVTSLDGQAEHKEALPLRDTRLPPPDGPVLRLQEAATWTGGDGGQAPQGCWGATSDAGAGPSP